MSDILETMRAELVEGASVLRRYYPNDDERQLLDRERYWRPRRYELGRWPDEEEIMKAKEEAEKAAREKAKAVADAA